ncbi:MAG: ubiquitin-like small modifier protein 1 [Haloglomus sp.]
MPGDEETVTFEFYGTVRDAVGEKTLSRTVEPGTTVNAALKQVAAEHPDLYSLLFTSEERLRPHINVSRDGEPIRDLDGPDTELTPGDRVTVAPSVSGGSGAPGSAGVPGGSGALGSVGVPDGSGAPGSASVSDGPRVPGSSDATGRGRPARRTSEGER